MSRDKKPADPPGDIPAWFMTYSDVITLLMTFFILLLTFATTQPERFEKSLSTTFSKGSGTGSAGKKMKTVDQETWINRVRPPAARISMRGAEMPPIKDEPSVAAFGEGMRSLNEEEEKQNELTSHAFEVPFVELFEGNGGVSLKGKQICGMLANQLDALPFHASIQTVNKQHVPNLAEMMHHLFHQEKARPGQLSVTLVKTGELAPEKIRIVIKRFSSNSEIAPHEPMVSTR